MFYLAGATLLALTVESCVKLLNRDSFSITLAVYVTVFGWYFVDPFLNPDQYRIYSFILNQPKLRAGSPIPDRVSPFYASRGAMDCSAAGNWQSRASTFGTGANSNRHWGALAAAVVHWYRPDGW